MKDLARPLRIESAPSERAKKEIERRKPWIETMPKVAWAWCFLMVGVEMRVLETWARTGSEEGE